MNNADQSVIGIIERAMTSRPFTIARVESLFGISLAPREGVHQPRFKVVEARIEPVRDGISNVELRVRTGQIGKGEAILILTVDPAARVTRERTIRAFGKGLSSPPSPSSPPAEPVYTVHEHDWGTLRLGFTRDADKRLVKVVMDAT